MKTEKEERDTIHPLPENVYQKLFIESLTNDDQFDSNDSKVETICKYGFSHSSIESILIPNSIKKIEGHAFSHCFKFKSIKFDKNSCELSTIGS